MTKHLKKIIIKKKLNGCCAYFIQLNTENNIKGINSYPQNHYIKHLDNIYTKKKRNFLHVIPTKKYQTGF